MATLTWRFSDHVDAPPDAVFAWMQDLREDDHDTPAFRRGAGAKPNAKPSRRRIVRREGGVVVLEDEWGRNKATLRATADVTRREIRLAGEWGYSAMWRVVADDRGTQVETEGRLAPRGLGGLLVPLFARGMCRQLESDFRGHIEHLREDFARKR